MAFLWRLVISCCLATAVCSQACNDIDTQACVLMAGQNPNLCQDPSVANTACPRYCNLCPLECYHCNATVTDYTSCSTRKACATGEQCLLRQVSSTVDGHHEYVMSCASPQVCDGVQPLIVGKRDISVHCCSSDGCNYPGTVPTTTTTPRPTTPARGCYKDIEVLIEDTAARSSFDTAVIQEFLKTLVGKLDIGDHETLMGVGTFDTGAHSAWDLDQYRHKADLLSALDHIHFHHRSNHIDYDDVIEFISEHLSIREGDRHSYDDVVIIITDAHHSGDVGDWSTLGHQAVMPKNVIVINLAITGIFDSLASDASHVINVHSYNDLFNYVTTVYNLVCS